MTATEEATPAVSSSWVFDQLSCDPAELTSRLTLDQDGRLEWDSKADAGGGITWSSGFGSIDSKGCICLANASLASAPSVKATRTNQTVRGSYRFPFQVKESACSGQLLCGSQ